MRLTGAIIVTALLVLCFPGATQATDQGRSLKYGGGGLGTVIFDGRMHAGKGYVCKHCHDDLFVTRKQARVRMSDHFTDTLCFKCHDNREAPKDCITCHREVASSGLIASDYMRSSMALPTASDEERDQLLTGRDGVSAQTRACLSCHGNRNLKEVTDRGKSLNLFVERAAYGVGAHGVLPCVSCHFGLEGAASFTRQPHALDQARKVDCKNCHSERLAKEAVAFELSAHMKKTEGRFSCINCHNAHSQPQKTRQPMYQAAVAEYNQACLNCHANPEKFAQVTKTPLNLKGMEHAFLTKFQAHKERVLCADCHSLMGAEGMGTLTHQILDKSQALRDCASCHRDTDSLIVARVALHDGNADSLSGSYIPGQKASGLVDRMGGWALLGLLALVLLHGMARIVSTKQKYTGETTRVFVYPLPVRLFHWINALCFILLLWTGTGIHFEGLPFVPALETAGSIHNYASYVLMLNFAVFLIYGISSGDIRQYLPKGPGIAAGVAAQARYYLSGMFTGAGKPFAVNPEQRFNPLQQISYLIVFIMGMPVLIFSGVMLLLPEDLTSAIANRETLALAHYCLAIAYGLFLLAHMYLATTGDSIFSLIRGMYSGYAEHREQQKK